MMVFAFNVMIIVPGQAAEGVHTEREHDLLHARARDGVRKRIVRWPVVVGCRCPPPLRFVARTGGTTTRNEAPYAHVQFTNCRKKICQTIRAGIYFCRQTTKRGSFAAKLRSGWRTGAHASASWLVASWCAAVALGTEQPRLHTALPASSWSPTCRWTRKYRCCTAAARPERCGFPTPAPSDQAPYQAPYQNTCPGLLARFRAGGGALPLVGGAPALERPRPRSM